MEFLMSVIITWGVGLSVPLILRYIILHRPLGKGASIAIAAVMLFVNIIIFSAMGSQSKTHTALYLIALVSYWILHSSNDDKSTNKQFQRKD